MYFDNFPKIIYNFNINNKEEIKVLTDITKNVRLRKEILSNITLFDMYIISDGETPEFIAEKVYGNPQYFWAIMLANDRYDYLTDFPMRQNAMERIISDKYGADNINDIHHYEAVINGSTYVVDSTIAGSNPVTNSDHEYAVNESKRIIKIISPAIIEKVAAEFGVM